MSPRSEREASNDSAVEAALPKRLYEEAAPNRPGAEPARNSTSPGLAHRRQPPAHLAQHSFQIEAIHDSHQVKVDNVRDFIKRDGHLIWPQPQAELTSYRGSTRVGRLSSCVGAQRLRLNLRATRVISAASL